MTQMQRMTVELLLEKMHAKVMTTAFLLLASKSHALALSAAISSVHLWKDVEQMSATLMSTAATSLATYVLTLEKTAIKSHANPVAQQHAR
jgi:hypothetical protein